MTDENERIQNKGSNDHLTILTNSLHFCDHYIYHLNTHINKIVHLNMIEM